MIDSIVKKKSDNLRILMCKIKVKIAKDFENKGNYEECARHLEEGLDVLEWSMIPPMMEYYKVYRYLGKVCFEMKQN